MCSEGNIEELRKALARGTNPNKKLDTDGSTALHAAAVQGHLEVVALLLKQPGIDWNQAANYGSTAFHHAAACGHQQVVDLLLEQPGINVNLTNGDGGATALHAAAYNGHLEVVARLLEQPGVDLTLVDNLG